MPERCPECNLLGGHLPGCSRVPAAPIYVPPNNLRSAAYVIGAVAFFYTLIPVIVLWAHWRYPMQQGQPLDTFARVFIACLIAFIALLWASSTFLLLRRRIGVYLWWACSPIVLLNVPLGTMAAMYVFRKLGSPEAEDALQSTKRSA